MSSKVAIVTGANMGVGYGIVRRLAREYPASFFAKSQAAEDSQKPLPIQIFLTSRTPEKGEKALKDIKEELKNDRVLKEDGGICELRYHQLDITSPDSIKGLIDYLKENHEGVDLLINNAGIAMDGFDSNVVRKTLETNFDATLNFTDEMTSVLNPNSRVVMIASMAGLLRSLKLSADLTRKFRAVDSVQGAKDLMSEFEEAVKNKKPKELKDEGWKPTAYSTSKCGLIAATRGLAEQWRKDGKLFVVNAVCPGYVNTSMTKGNGQLSIDEGAATPVKVALEDLRGKGLAGDGGSKELSGMQPSGGFWQEGAEVEW